MDQFFKLQLIFINCGARAIGRPYFIPKACYAHEIDFLHAMHTHIEFAGVYLKGKGAMYRLPFELKVL